MVKKNKYKIIQKTNRVKSLTGNAVSCDFETLVYNNRHYVCAYGIVDHNFVEYKDIIKKCSPEEIEQESNNLISEFLKCCASIQKVNPKSKFIFHNLSKFDGKFLLDYACNFLTKSSEILKQNSRYYRIIIFFDYVGIIFQDSYLLIPLSLDKLAKSFNKTHFKSSFLHETDSFNKYLKCDVYREELLIYCVKDCQVLYEAYNVFRNIIFNLFGIDCLQALTISSLALKIFKSNFYDCDIENTGLKKDKELFLRKAYTGGSVEVYKPILDSGFHYDINSLYASVMYKYDYPVGVGNWVAGESLNLNTFFGFIETEVECDFMEKPLLNYRNKDKISLAGYGHWKSVYFSEEIIKAQELGYKFKFIKGLQYERGHVFKDYVEKIYDFRIKNPSRDHPLNVTAKILLNGLYGKFGVRDPVVVSKIIDADSFFREDFPGLTNFHYIGDKVLINYVPNEKLKMENMLLSNLNLQDVFNYGKNLEESTPVFLKESAVQLSAAVTSYGRLEIYKYKSMEHLNVAYSDTDSIFCQNELDPVFIDQHKLGSMKLESSFKNGIFINPKVYYHEPDKGSSVKKAKGLGGKDLTKQDFLDLLKSDSKIKILLEKSFITNTNNFIVKVGTTRFTLNNFLYKRKKLFDKEGNWINTESIFIDELPRET